MNQPKDFVFLELKVKLSSIIPLHAVLKNLVTCLLVDELTEFSYGAEIAGFDDRLCNTSTGISLRVDGCNHELTTMLETILKCTKNFIMNEERLGSSHLAATAITKKELL